MSGGGYRPSSNCVDSGDVVVRNNAEDDDDEHRVVETDPTGRFERYAKCLGQGAYKNVYMAFDTEEGVEVAWNQFRIDHLFKNHANRICSEIRILESLRNDHIINLFASWTAKKDGKDSVFFITELMTSGTLKAYIRKTKGPVKPKVLKSWCRQILSGLRYLHSRSPPIIHRDLKCENIFINGNNGQAKIGDLGLAVVKRSDHVSSVLGTPEFMAPELYDERYDEKVDIYAFGMVVLEIVTKEYPYSECDNQAQIYKKVTSGIKPAAVGRVSDAEVRGFIEHCIESDPQKRPGAAELLNHPFLMTTTASAPPATGEEHTRQSDQTPKIETSPYSISRNQSQSRAESLSSESHAFSAASTGSPVADSAIGTWSGASALSARTYQSHPSHHSQIWEETVTHVSSTPDDLLNPVESRQETITPEPISSDAATHTFIVRRTPSAAHIHNGSGSSSSAQIPSGGANSDQWPSLTSEPACTVEIVERVSDEAVLIRMVYTSGAKTDSDMKEIKFPFHLGEDTAHGVVEEMMGEGIIDKWAGGVAAILDKVVQEFLRVAAGEVRGEKTVRHSEAISVAVSKGEEENISTGISTEFEPSQPEVQRKASASSLRPTIQAPTAAMSSQQPQKPQSADSVLISQGGPFVMSNPVPLTKSSTNPFLLLSSNVESRSLEKQESPPSGIPSLTNGFPTPSGIEVWSSPAVAATAPIDFWERELNELTATSSTLTSSSKGVSSTLDPEVQQRLWELAERNLQGFGKSGTKYTSPSMIPTSVSWDMKRPSGSGEPALPPVVLPMPFSHDSTADSSPPGQQILGLDFLVFSTQAPVTNESVELLSATAPGTGVPFGFTSPQSTPIPTTSSTIPSAGFELPAAVRPINSFPHSSMPLRTSIVDALNVISPNRSHTASVEPISRPASSLSTYGQGLHLGTQSSTSLPLYEWWEDPPPHEDTSAFRPDTSARERGHLLD
ncbi:hypothetical protein BC832DRAFT_558344 [Gaertneriomyces semiglobifer]|nr:hypothetical protein BC832DRAFT_558344 [Gaertneriomyces semiglobifer]